jgi:hypothetical protein
MEPAPPHGRPEPPSGGTIPLIGFLLLPITFPIVGLAVLIRMIARPARPGDRSFALVLLAMSLAITALVAVLPDAALLALLAAAIAFLVLVAVLARRSLR